MNNPANPKCNAEGYNDPTAFYGTQKIVREESETERRANELIKVLKFIIRSTGFELIERVKIRDVKTGKGVQIMNIDERYRAAEDEAQLEYIKQWRERKRKKKDRRKDYWMETVWHLRMFFDMLFKFVKG